jgi:cell division inhibitor SepF
MAMGTSAAGGWRDDDFSDEDYDDYEDYAPVAAPAPRPGSTIAIVEARDHQEPYAVGERIGEYFRRGVPVIINLEDLTIENAKRVVDFVSGTIFGLRGDIERLSNRLFLIIPPGATVLKP